jgi:hypothetical protein
MGPGRFIIPLQALAPGLTDRLILGSFKRSVRRRLPESNNRS